MLQYGALPTNYPDPDPDAQKRTSSQLSLPHVAKTEN